MYTSGQSLKFGSEIAQAMASLPCSVSEILSPVKLKMRERSSLDCERIFCSTFPWTNS